MSTKRRATREMNYTDISIDDSEGEEEEMAPTSDGAEETASFDGAEETASFDGGDILESASILSGVIGQKDEGGNQAPPKRKRQKLTHLTEEEKMMRRKLKNR